MKAKLPHLAIALALSATLATGGPAGAEPGPLPVEAGNPRTSELSSASLVGSSDLTPVPVSASLAVPEEQRFQRLSQALSEVEQRESLTAEQAAEYDRMVLESSPSLARYPDLERVHSHREPAWLDDRGYATAQAVRLLVAVEKQRPDPERRMRIRQLASGLASLSRPERVEYPFGAHLSWRDLAPFARLDGGQEHPGSVFRTERSYAVQALVAASQILGDKDLLMSAERGALGMGVHLVIYGKPIAGFSPAVESRPSSDWAAVEPTLEGFWTLYRATGKRLYADLSALALQILDAPPTEPESRAAYQRWRELLSGTSASVLLRAEGDEPISFQVMEAEDGRVVNKAGETIDYRTPLGSAGRLAQMGRENTFWMRFDVPTEDDYLFYLNYLQSDVGGGLVSVMMRIDGDRIFQVPLGDVDGIPILRRKFVDGPRPLRSGPHSFGIRFSGLLMTKPALLDSVVVQPCLERRSYRLPNGDIYVLVRNMAAQVGRTGVENFPHWPPNEVTVMTGDGESAALGSDEDRRRRKNFVTLPPYGVALLKFASPGAELE